jgi:heterodisulfide reductase subunit A-like polyferredoxin
MIIKRRYFIKTGIFSAITPFATIEAIDFNKNNSTVLEPKRELPVVKQTDVIVCGGGPAGVGAALSAARSGAKTTLIDFGTFVSGIRHTSCGTLYKRKVKNESYHLRRHRIFGVGLCVK